MADATIDTTPLLFSCVTEKQGEEQEDKFILIVRFNDLTAAGPKFRAMRSIAGWTSVEARDMDEERRRVRERREVIMRALLNWALGLYYV